MSNPFSDLAHKAEHTVNDIKHKVEHNAHDAKHNLEHVGHEMQHNLDPSHIFHEFESEFEHIADKAQDELKHLGNTLEKDIKHELNKAKDFAIHEMNVAWAELQKAGKHLGRWLEDESVSHALHFAWHAIHFLEDYIPPTAQTGIGGVEIIYNDIHEKIDHFAHYVHKPPKGRHEIIDCFFTLAPSDIKITEKVSAAFIVDISLFSESGGISIHGSQVQAVLNKVFDTAEAIRDGDTDKLHDQANQIISNATKIVEDKAKTAVKEKLTP